MSKRIFATLMSIIIIASGSCVFLPTAEISAEALEVAINNAEDFSAMASDGSYYLTNNITLTAVWNSAETFTGHLDGNGNTITLCGTPMFNNFAGTLENIRLEGYIGTVNNAYPSDAGPVTVNVTGNASFYNVSSYASVIASGNAGGIAGTCVSDLATVRFENCTFGGTVSSGLSSDFYAGGITGYTGGEVSVDFLNCAMSGSVSGNSSAGGILGYACGLGVNAFDCVNTGSVTSNHGGAGGIIGLGGENLIYIKNSVNGSESASNAGVVTSGGDFVGGIFAYHPGGYTIIENCTNYQNINSSAAHTGGIAGLLCGSSYISYCFNHGNITSSVSGESYTGGIAGGVINPGNILSGYVFLSRIEYCSNYGDIVSNDSVPDQCGTGGILGFVSEIRESLVTGNLNCGNVSSVGGRVSGICGYTIDGSLSVRFNCNSGVISTGAASGTCALSQIISSSVPSLGTNKNFYLSGGAPAIVYLNTDNTISSLNPDGFYFTSGDLSDGSLVSRLNSSAAGGSGNPGSLATDMAAYYGILFQNLLTDSYPSTDRSRGVVYYYVGYTNFAPAGFSPLLTAATAAQFVSAADTIASVANFTGQLIINADIDLSLIPDFQIEHFSGLLEGNGHNLNISCPLIGQLSGSVNNLSLTGSINDASSESEIGSLASSVFGLSEISCVISSVNITAQNTAFAGGLIGRIEAGRAAFSDCSNSGSIAALDYSGGIVGVSGQSSTFFDSCTNEGTISSQNAGGIIGAASPNGYGTSRFDGCLNTGNIEAGLFAGGIAAKIFGMTAIEDCLSGSDTPNTVTVSSLGSAGGLIGFIGGLTGEDDLNTFHSIIEDSKNRASVSAASGYCAGIVANVAIRAALRNLENSGNVGASGANDVFSGGIAGLIDCLPSAISRCRNSGNISATKYSAGIVGYIKPISGVSSRCDIRCSFNSGDISTSSYPGGIVGYCDGGNVYIDKSGNYGDVFTTGSIAGGVLGYVKNCTSIGITYSYTAGGVITAGTYASGIMGYGNIYGVSITSCYGYGTISCGKPANSCALMYSNKVVTGNVSGNWFSLDFAPNLSREPSTFKAFNSEYCYTYEDIVTGELAYLMNRAADAEIFFQTLDSLEADLYPTTDNTHGSVNDISETLSGEIGFGNEAPETMMLTGASVRLSSSSSGIRFTSYISYKSIRTVLNHADAGTEPKYGTLIIPTDYLDDYNISQFTIRSLKTAGIDEYNFVNTSENVNINGLYYINIPAENGYLSNPDGSAYINAALVDLKSSSYSRRFSAVSYIKYTSHGKDYYIYSEYEAEKNSRSMELVASRALTDVSSIKNAANGYVNQLDDGTWSLYSDDARQSLQSYLTDYSITFTADTCFSITMYGAGLGGSAKYGSILIFTVNSTDSSIVPKVFINETESVPESDGKYRVTVSANITIRIVRS